MIFKKFGDYMFYLLTAPLKKDKQHNQFYLFFKVTGTVFDDIKQDIFKLRRQRISSTAEPVMLDIIGQDRKMTRLQGEPVEAWRKRLQMKAIIAELAGSEKGILLALESVGYDYAYIEPLWKADPERWAEINVVFQKDIDEEEYIDFQSIKQAVMETKQASTFPHFIFHYTTRIQLLETLLLARVICRFILPFWTGIRLLDGSWLLDGEDYLNAELVRLPCRTRHRTGFLIPERLEEGTVTVIHNLWYLDGSYLLDGEQTIDAYKITEAI